VAGAMHRPRYSVSRGGCFSRVTDSPNVRSGVARSVATLVIGVSSVLSIALHVPLQQSKGRSE
jgi:hypothetical protein